jgi:hypothetical protein
MPTRAAKTTAEITHAHVADVTVDGDYVVQLRLSDGTETERTIPAFAVTSRALFERATGHFLPETYGDRERDPFYYMLVEMYDDGHTPAGVTSAAKILSQPHEPLGFVIPKVLPEGTTLLGGKPKIGKSWLTLQMAMAIASGGEVLGQEIETPQTVLYLALEDSPRRLASRMEALGGLSDEAARSLLICNTWQPLDEGGLDLLAAYIDKENPRAVFIDVLQKLRTPGKGTSENAYERDYRAISKLHRIAQERKGLAMVAVHHHRKGESEDFVEAMSGSYGLTGVVDTVVSLSRPRSKERGTLSLAARDGAELDWMVDFRDGRWTFGLDVDDAPTESDRDVLFAIEKLREELSDGPVPSKEAKSDMASLNISTTVLRQAVKELKIRPYQGFNDATEKRCWWWTLPNPPAAPELLNV